MRISTLVAVSMMTAFATPALAADAYYVVQDAKTKKCTITEIQADFHGNDCRERQHCLQNQVRGRSWHEDHQGLHNQLGDFRDKTPGDPPGFSFAHG